MPPWVANLIGLALGFTIGGEALYFLFAKPDVGVPPSVVEEAAPLPVPQPARLPRIVAPTPPRADVLPQVIYPEQSAPRPKQGTGIAGTGFFVATDGSLLTAAHVVTGCQEMRIASQWIKPSPAQLLAIDTGQDIALLRASRVRPPALLPVGRPAGSGGALFVLGYPSAGDTLVPTETWAVLQNAQLQPGPPELTDPRRVIWALAPAIGHGFSGGPMLDPRNGEVVGIVRGTVDSTHLHAVRASIPEYGMVIGPGSLPLTTLLRQERADGDVLAASGEHALDAARRATVHVFCRD